MHRALLALSVHVLRWKSIRHQLQKKKKRYPDARHGPPNRFVVCLVRLVNPAQLPGANSNAEETDQEQDCPHDLPPFPSLAIWDGTEKNHSFGSFLPKRLRT